MTIKECRNCKYQVESKHTGKCPQCDREAGYKTVVVMNESIGLGDKVTITKFFGFKLLNPIPYEGNLANSQKIIWEVNKTDKGEKLIGFRIRVDDNTLEEEKEAIQLATKLTNFLSLKLRQFVYHNKPEPIINDNLKHVGKSLTMKYDIYGYLDLDLSDKSVVSLLNEDMKMNMQLDHYSNGMKALEDEQHGESIRRFCLSLGNEFPTDLNNGRKYDHLRNALSHPELIDEKGNDRIRDINALKNFQLILTKNKDNCHFYLNPRLPENIPILKKHTLILKKAVEQILDKK